ARPRRGLARARRAHERRPHRHAGGPGAGGGRLRPERGEPDDRPSLADRHPRRQPSLPVRGGGHPSKARMSKDPFLEHARLGARSDTLIEYEEIPHLPRLKRRAREYALADLAHAVMLVEEGILSADRGARLLDGLLHILEHGLATFPWNPRVGSYLPQAESYLAARIGEDIAGRLQTGRSRNDQSGAAERLWMRDLLLDLSRDLLALQRAI